MSRQGSHARVTRRLRKNFCWMKLVFYAIMPRGQPGMTLVALRYRTSLQQVLRHVQAIVPAPERFDEMDLSGQSCPCGVSCCCG